MIQYLNVFFKCLKGFELSSEDIMDSGKLIVLESLLLEKKELVRWLLLVGIKSLLIYRLFLKGSKSARFQPVCDCARYNRRVHEN